MITRILMLTLRKNNVNMHSIRHYAKRDHRCDAHMNELPIPCIPWEPWYTNKQKYYKKWLITGIIWMIFSISMTLYTQAIFLNWGPPPQPAPPYEMIEECDDNDT